MLSRKTMYWMYLAAACLVAPISITLILLHGFGIIHLGEAGQNILGASLVGGVGIILLEIYKAYLS